MGRGFDSPHLHRDFASYVSRDSLSESPDTCEAPDGRRDGEGERPAVESARDELSILRQGER